ncbi:MAG: DUF2834 domain-containing protein [Pseudohongiellaceae bacterium]
MSVRSAYLLLAIVGAIMPYAFYIDFARAEGINLSAFLGSLFANGAVGGFTADLLISSLVFWIYMFNRRNQGPRPGWFILLNLTIGLSCALPAYLWAASRPAVSGSPP